MTSVLRFIKQRPSDSQYFISLRAAPSLNIFTADPQNPTLSYVSGAAAGRFSLSTVGGSSDADPSGTLLQIFRDMGVTIVSSLRTFRRVQLLTLDQGAAVPAAGQGIEWSSQGTPQGAVGSGTGVFVQGGSTEGVTGTQVAPSNYADSSFNVFYFETGANGLGIAQGLVRYG